MIDPAVRDLLVAIYDALDATQSSYERCAVQTAIATAIQYPRLPLATEWLISQAGEVADAKRVRSADRWDLYREWRR